MDLLFEHFLTKIWKGEANLLNLALRTIIVIFQIKNWIQVKFSRPKLSMKLVKLTPTQK